MSVRKLQSFIDDINIAESLSEEELRDIGSQVCQTFDDDYESMSDWLDGVEQGIELMKQEFEGKSFPWDGASNYKDPILFQASIGFGDKASQELLRNKDLVSSEIVGRESDEKKQRAERVVEYMNYQVNHDMGDWRGDQESLYYCISVSGCMFKKTNYDPYQDRAESALVYYPNFVVNQATEDMESCLAFSEVMDFSDNEVEIKVRSGRWLPLDTPSMEETGTDIPQDKQSNEAQKVNDSILNPEAFIEQQTWLDLDEDGVREPYTVTVKRKSKQVVRIVARYDSQSIMVKLNGRIYPLPEAIEEQNRLNLESMGGPETMALINMPPPEVDPDSFEVCNVNAFQNITKYGFIKNPDGTFLDLGYSHLLGALTQILNSTTNQLTDAGTLANIGASTGLLSKEFRKEMGVNRLRFGEFKRTNVPADKLANGIFQLQAGEPSETLYKLNVDKRNIATSFLATVDLSEMIQSNTAPTTALAMIMEANVPTTALFKRLLKSQSHEFQVLFRLNQRTLDDRKYQQVLDDPAARVEDDFNSFGMDIVPTADAQMSTKMQRMQVSQIEMEQVPLVVQAGLNPVPILRNFFENIGSQSVDEIFAEQSALSEEDKRIMQQMTQAQEQANQIQQLQLEILRREQDRLDAKARADIDKIYKEIEELSADIVKTMADAAKSAEEAEGQNIENRITTYSTGIQDALNRLLEVNNDRQAITQSPLIGNGINPTRTIQ